MLPTGADSSAKRGRLLDLIERVGNSIPEPAILFAIFAALVVAIAAIGDAAGWSVQPVQPVVQLVDKLGPDGRVMRHDDGTAIRVPVLDESGRPEITLEPKGEPITPRTMLTSEGVYWMLSSMLRNFTHLPALGLIFVSILGIGLAEKFGMFGAAMRWLAQIAPKRLLTPIIVMVGANSSLASDAGVHHPAATGSGALCGVGTFTHRWAGGGVQRGWRGGFAPGSASTPATRSWRARPSRRPTSSTPSAASFPRPTGTSRQRRSSC